MRDIGGKRMAIAVAKSGLSRAGIELVVGKDEAVRRADARDVYGYNGWDE